MSSMPNFSKMDLPRIKRIIAVASGKGGVGKSTVSTNLAMALHFSGKKVGLLDADIYGPSIPLMLGIKGEVNQATTQLPLNLNGLLVMSMGFLVPKNKAIIWRGPMVHRALTQFLTQLDWGDLDYLVIDLPPGTGDAQLTLTQSVPLTAAVIVTTPQEVSLIDARKGLEMFREVNVPVLGIIENMSYFVGDDGKKYLPFKSGGGGLLARECSVPLLGEIPIDPKIAECGDDGIPIRARHPDSAVSTRFSEISNKIVEELDSSPMMPALPTLEMT
ncbi:MAG: Mrp/NBP35 family ATP-binding protein [Planctomycetota bacterium]